MLALFRDCLLLLLLFCLGAAVSWGLSEFVEFTAGIFALDHLGGWFAMVCWYDIEKRGPIFHDIRAEPRWTIWRATRLAARRYQFQLCAIALSTEYSDQHSHIFLFLLGRFTGFITSFYFPVDLIWRFPTSYLEAADSLWLDHALPVRNPVGHSET